MGLEVARPERAIGIVVDVGREARRHVDGAARRDHQLREVATNVDLLQQASSAKVCELPVFDVKVERQRRLQPDQGARVAARNCSQMFLPVCVSRNVPPFHSIQYSAM